MKSHVLTVIAEDLSPSHIIAALKHWISKIEQEIMNRDGGPQMTGVHEMEHDGKAIAVTSSPGLDVKPLTAPLAANEDPLTQVGVTSQEAQDAIGAAINDAAAPSEATNAAEHAAAQPDSTAADVAVAEAQDAA